MLYLVLLLFFYGKTPVGGCYVFEKNEVQTCCDVISHESWPSKGTLQVYNPWTKLYRGFWFSSYWSTESCKNIISLYSHVHGMSK